MQQMPIVLDFEHDPRCPDFCGQLGLTIAHSKIWNDIVARNLSYALILEDDVVLHDDVCKIVDGLSSRVPPTWEVAYLGWLPRDGPQHSIDSLRFGGVMPWTTHAYFVSYAGAQRLIRVLNYFLAQANLTEFVSHENHGNTRDHSWLSVLSSHNDDPIKPITSSLIKIDFVMISVFNFFLTDRERQNWLQLGSTLPNKVLGVKWEGVADWQGTAKCKSRRKYSEAENGLCACSEWTSSDCFCADAEGAEINVNIPLLGGGLAYQHRCAGSEVKYFPRWFDQYPEKSERCLTASTLSFSVEEVSPPCTAQTVRRMPHCHYVGQTFSTIEFWSNVSYRFMEPNGPEIVRLKAYGVPCRESGQTDVTCCDRDLYVRPKATDLHVAVQTLFYQEFGFLLGMRDSIPQEHFSPTKIQYILDAGGNCGLSALYFASIFPDATIVTVEANPKNFQTLQKNTETFKNIISINKGIWDKTTFLRVGHFDASRHGREWDFQVVETADEKNSIPAVSINDLLRELDLPRFDLIKMDIEGSEKEVFEAPDLNLWLSDVKVFLAELHPDSRKGSDTAVHKHLRQRAYLQFNEGEYEVYVRK
jgi:FkbM family methyltransferase